jgi:hypothetical protein
VQKSKARKSVSNVNPSNVQRVIDGEPSNLSQQSSLRNESSTSASSDTSSNVPSLASSSSSTPRIDAVDMGNRSDSFQQMSSPPIKDEVKQPRLQLGMMGLDGFKQPPGELGWTDEWSGLNAQPASAKLPGPMAAPSSCCQPQTIPEEPMEAPPQSSCCAPKATTPFTVPGAATHDRHHPNSQAMRQMSRNEHHGFENAPLDNTANFGMTYTEPFTFGPQSFGSVPQGLDFFGELEGREGCGSHIYVPEQLDSGNVGHNCHCGENCDCLGCATHPANRTTTEYVRYHNDLASRGYFLPSRVHAPLSTIQQQSPYGMTSTSMQYTHPPSTSINNVERGHFGSRFNQSYSPAPAYGVSNNDIPSWQLGSQIPILTPTNELQQFHINTSNAIPPSITPANQFQFHDGFHSGHSHQFQVLEPQQPPPSNAIGKTAAKGPVTFELPQRKVRDTESVFDHDSPSTDDDTSTLSPSSFHIQQFNVPGCNDITGTCQCGEGCQCPGCLTHSGHGEEPDIEVEVEGGHATEQASVRAGHGHDLNGFSVDNFHHDTIFPTSVPG